MFTSNRFWMCVTSFTAVFVMCFVAYSINNTKQQNEAECIRYPLSCENQRNVN